MTTATLKQAHAALLARYDGILAMHGATPSASVEGLDDAHLRWMCQTALKELSCWPDDKASRWLGFIQGVMACRGYLTVAGEREHSRPIFHAAYQAQGQMPPSSAGARQN